MRGGSRDQKTQKLIPLIGGINGIKNRVFDPLIGGGSRDQFLPPLKGELIPDPYTHLRGAHEGGQLTGVCGFVPHHTKHSWLDATLPGASPTLTPASSAQGNRNQNKRNR